MNTDEGNDHMFCIREAKWYQWKVNEISQNTHAQENKTVRIVADCLAKV